MVFVWLLFYLQFIVIPKSAVKTSDHAREPRYLAGQVKKRSPPHILAD